MKKKNLYLVSIFLLIILIATGVGFYALSNSRGNSGESKSSNSNTVKDTIKVESTTKDIKCQKGEDFELCYPDYFTKYEPPTGSYSVGIYDYFVYDGFLPTAPATISLYKYSREEEDPTQLDVCRENAEAFLQVFFLDDGLTKIDNSLVFTYFKDDGGNPIDKEHSACNLYVELLSNHLESDQPYVNVELEILVNEGYMFVASKRERFDTPIDVAKDLERAFDQIGIK